MRVLHIISSGGMYGAEAVILQLCQASPGGGAEIGVFSHGDAAPPALHEAARGAGISSALIPCRTQLDRASPAAIRKLVDETNADVVHAHGYKADIYTFFAFRRKRRPALVSTCHTWYDNDAAVRVYGALDRWVLRSFDAVVAVSEAVRQRLLAAGVREGKISLVPNGVDVGRFGSIPARRAAREPGTPLTFGLVGRLAPEKGVDVFLRAAALLQSDLPAAHFMVAGDGPERGALENLIRELGLQDRVSLLGVQKDMAAFYASVDVLVSASNLEGLPMALLEGMATGLPVAGTAVGEVPSVVLEGTTGHLAPPGSPGALAEAVRKVVAERVPFGEASRNHIQDNFSAIRMAERYQAIYERALESRGRQGSVGQ